MSKFNEIEPIITIFIQKQTTKRFETVRLEMYVKNQVKYRFSYQEFGDAVKNLVQENKLRPVVKRGKNGMEPQLYLYYQIITEKVEIPEQIALEMRAEYTGYFDMNYYLKRPDEYMKDRNNLLAIKQFLMSRNGEVISLNERSFNLFHDEKALELDKVKLSRIGLSISDLDCENAPEPFIFMPRKITDEASINVLIIENKATFDSLKRLIKESIYSYDGVEFHLIIYGQGNKIVGSFPFFYDLELYEGLEVQFFYFGDIDLQGIYIWYQLSKVNRIHVKPFTYFYRALLEQGRSRQRAVDPNQTHSEEAVADFLSYFDSVIGKEMLDIMVGRKCIPQEGIDRWILRGLGKGAH